MPIDHNRLAVTTSNSLVIDGVNTNWRVRQVKDVTEVYGFSVPWNVNSNRIVLPLPHGQYSTWADKPACGHGWLEFYHDVKAAIALYEKEKASA
jgi:hypothetical protein